MNWPNRVRGSRADFLKPRCDSHKHATFKKLDCYFQYLKRRLDSAVTSVTRDQKYLIIILLGVASSKLRQPDVLARL